MKIKMFKVQRFRIDQGGKSEVSQKRGGGGAAHQGLLGVSLALDVREHQVGAQTVATDRKSVV